MVVVSAPDSAVTLDGDTLSLDQLVAISRGNQSAAVPEVSRERIKVSRLVIEEVLRGEAPVYGVTTGFGALHDRVIRPQDIELLQENIILSHAAGVGAHLPCDVVRAMIALRVNTFAKGFSGVRPELVDALLALLNRGVTPMVPIQGSVGSSGDLAPLAHMSAVLLGRGSAYYRGKLMPGARALRAAGLAPITLAAKEGLALTNGTQFMTAMGALTLYDARNLATCADIAAALTLEALKGRSSAFRPRIGDLRPHVGHEEAAGNIRRMVAGSQFVDRADDDTKGVVQDAYSLRCVPQVHGASRSALGHVHQTLNVEMNSVNDNPIVLPEEAEICSAGNFHGQPMALVLDYLAIAVSELASISERRCARLLDNRDNRGLPAFLVANSGLNSGLMIAQYTAAALVSENKSLAHPASVDSIPTSANQEDHNSMGSVAARHARAIADNVTQVLAIEMLCACQGLAFRLNGGLSSGDGTSAAYRLIRESVPTLDTDRELYEDIKAIAGLITSRRLPEAVAAATGPLS